MPQTKTLQSSYKFPVGTSVSVYPRGTADLPPVAGAPAGVVAAAATVAADGSLTFPNLPDNQRFWAYANVSSVDQYVGFDTYLTLGTPISVPDGNTVGTLLPSAAQTATVASPAQVNTQARGVTVFVNVTAVSGTTPTLAPIIQALDPASNVYAELNATPTNITATGLYIYQVYPGEIVPGAATGITQVAAVQLPRNWRVNFVIGGTTPSFTFSADYEYAL